MIQQEDLRRAEEQLYAKAGRMGNSAHVGTATTPSYSSCESYNFTEECVARLKPSSGWKKALHLVDLRRRNSRAKFNFLPTVDPARIRGAPSPTQRG